MLTSWASEADAVHETVSDVDIVSDRALLQRNQAKVSSLVQTSPGAS